MPSINKNNLRGTHQRKLASQFEKIEDWDKFCNSLIEAAHKELENNTFYPSFTSLSWPNIIRAYLLVLS